MDKYRRKQYINEKQFSPVLGTKQYNKDGGLYGNPFWKSMRKKNGKDWREIFTRNLGNRR